MPQLCGRVVLVEFWGDRATPRGVQLISVWWRVKYTLGDFGGRLDLKAKPESLQTATPFIEIAFELYSHYIITVQQERSQFSQAHLWTAESSGLGCAEFLCWEGCATAGFAWCAVCPSCVTVVFTYFPSGPGWNILWDSSEKVSDSSWRELKTWLSSWS